MANLSGKSPADDFTDGCGRIVGVCVGGVTGEEVTIIQLERDGPAVVGGAER